MAHLALETHLAIRVVSHRHILTSALHREAHTSWRITSLPMSVCLNSHVRPRVYSKYQAQSECMTVRWLYGLSEARCRCSPHKIQAKPGVCGMPKPMDETQQQMIYLTLSSSLR